MCFASLILLSCQKFVDYYPNPDFYKPCEWEDKQYAEVALKNEESIAFIDEPLNGNLEIVKLCLHSGDYIGVGWIRLKTPTRKVVLEEWCWVKKCDDRALNVQ